MYIYPGWSTRRSVTAATLHMVKSIVAASGSLGSETWARRNQHLFESLNATATLLWAPFVRYTMVDVVHVGIVC